MAFNPTDFPCPVAPATNKCGILVRSIMKISLVIVRPKATGSSNFDSWNFLEAMIECIETTCGSLFGTSIPIVPLPGIGAMIRIPVAARLSMISYSRFLILEMRTPAFGTIS